MQTLLWEKVTFIYLIFTDVKLIMFFVITICFFLVV